MSPDELVSCTEPLQKEIPSGAAVTAGTDYGGLGLRIRTEAIPYLSPTDQPGVGETIDAGTVGLMITNDRASEGVFPALIISGDVNPRETAVGFQGAVISGYNGLSVTGTNDGIAVTGTTAFIAQSGGTGSILFEGTASNGTTAAQLNDSGD